MTGDPAGPEKPALSARSAARLAVVQGLYQMDIAGTDLNEVVAEFEAHRFAGARPGAEPRADAPLDELLAGADRTFFAELLRGVVRRQRDIDPLVDQQLAEGWRLARVDSLLRAILRAGVLELLERPDVPARVVINEYVEIGYAFLADDERRVVNGVLDQLARRLRPSELAPRPGGEQAEDRPRGRERS
jgi:N utilization substance protein B